MRTPTEYSKNIKNHIITDRMLVDCLYSVNKRAKNWRDKEGELRYKRKHDRYWEDKYDSETKAKEQKEMYYQQKDILLTVIEPECIHREIVDFKRERIYDYEPKYKEHMKEFVWTNSYYDQDIDDYVHFGDILLKDCPIYKYYLFYDIGYNHTFHKPITEEEVNEYKIQVKDIDRLITTGDDITDLLSNQFVQKVIELIKGNDFTFVLEQTK